MTAPETFSASLLVDTDDPALFARAIEAMSRALAGLALDGVDGVLMTGADTIIREHDHDTEGNEND